VDSHPVSVAGAASLLHHYVVLRADLPVGAKVAQCVHAAGNSAVLLGRPLPPDTHAVVLSVPDEQTLLGLAGRLGVEDIPHVLITEPAAPFNNQATALGIVPINRERVRRLLSKFPLLR
jgi:hypothetical protein